MGIVRFSPSYKKELILKLKIPVYTLNTLHSVSDADRVISILGENTVSATALILPEGPLETTMIESDFPVLVLPPKSVNL